MDLGPHAVFIWLCYAITAVVIAGLILWLWQDGVRLNVRLAAFDAANRDRSEAKDG